MPKSTEIKSILIIGSGPIVIGQACEFDYSGSQACKVLRQEGYRIILINSNPATIMTDPEMADAVYIEPITWQTVEKIIEKERPDALLPTMGGQTALNCALDLDKHGILEKYQVKMIGANKKAINLAEDREKFRQAMEEINLATPKSFMARKFEDVFEIESQLDFPIILRPSFTLGGTGGGIAYNREELHEILKRGLDLSPTSEVLLEESVLGWKEIEMEVVRDKNDNCIIVCGIENFDPMGVHTGDSITFAPIQTLTDKEYQELREASIKVLRKIGVETGGSNVQFALNPRNGRILVIEMNPRVSRSSALASKATGFPIAKVAAKLAVGYTLDELQNEITGGAMPASFEPSIDYVVTKIPRFAFEKFVQANDKLTTQMKSVGEVMAFGRNISESMQKALRSLEQDLQGFDEIIDQNLDKTEKKALLQNALSQPGPDRILYVADAFRAGYTIEQVNEWTGIDPWFLQAIFNIIETEKKLSQAQLVDLAKEDFYQLKQNGFSDGRIATLLARKEAEIRKARHSLGVFPVYKRVDSCAAEFPVTTAYLYGTYDEECEAYPTDKQKIVILGSGPNRIGQGIEFDYCCVQAAYALREDNYETIIINCNPETVSTDYDTADRLYFEPLTLEDVLEILAKEKPAGIIVQYGGQTPLKLANAIEQAGFTIVGTSPASIDLAEDREKFQQLIHKAGLKQPPNRTARSADQALKLAEEIGYPLVVRPSYVLGGRGMEIVYQPEELERYMQEAVLVSNDAPVLLDGFLEDAIEVDADAVCDGQEVIVGGIMEHIEQAGIHSGDSACCLPPFSLSAETQRQLTEQIKVLGHALAVKGLMNVQFAIQNQEIYILEVNPRAARTIPFVSKTIGLSLAKIGARCMLGQSLTSQQVNIPTKLSYYSVKEAVFPFIKFPEVDPLLGPEMKSTGEVMGVGFSFAEAFAKSQLAAGVALPKGGKAFLSVREQDRDATLEIAQRLLEKGFELLATRGTAAFLEQYGITCTPVNKVRQGRPHIVDMIKNDQISLIVNTTEGKQAIADSFTIRREALQHKVCYTTTIAAAQATSLALDFLSITSVKSLQALHKELI